MEFTARVIVRAADGSILSLGRLIPVDHASVQAECARLRAQFPAYELDTSQFDHARLAIRAREEALTA